MEDGERGERGERVVTGERDQGGLASALAAVDLNQADENPEEDEDEDEDENENEDEEVVGEDQEDDEDDWEDAVGPL